MASTDTPTTKTCKKCGIEKPIDDFCKYSASKDGRDSVCRPCVAKYTAERKAAKLAAEGGTPAPAKRTRAPKTMADGKPAAPAGATEAAPFAPTQQIGSSTPKRTKKPLTDEHRAARSFAQRARRAAKRSAPDA